MIVCTFLTIASLKMLFYYDDKKAIYYNQKVIAFLDFQGKSFTGKGICRRHDAPLTSI